MSMADYYAQEKQRYLNGCTRCGLCAQGCPILAYTDIAEISSRDVQQGVFDFMASGTANPYAYTKAFACMQCFKCTAGMCPEGLNPMLVNELIKGEYLSRKPPNRPIGDAGQPDSAHRVLASVQVTGPELSRISAASDKQSARYVFFPGCNVYFQPEKILNALDILAAIGDDYAFLPGLDHCCGNRRLFMGEIPAGAEMAEALVSAIAAFQPEAAIFWCPTCQCRFDLCIAAATQVPFKTLSLPQYVAANMGRLRLSRAAAGTVTLHEACKAAYTGVGGNAPREILQQLPGVTLSEMQRHGRDTLCCGSGADSWFPESGARLRRVRLQDAAQTGAQRLVTVCHYCQQTLAADASGCDFRVSNYVNLVAEAMGIRREETFTRYQRWGSLNRILKDAADAIAKSPFKRERVVEVLQEVFSK